VPLVDGFVFVPCMRAESSRHSPRPSAEPAVAAPSSSAIIRCRCRALIRLAFSIAIALNLAGRRRVRTATPLVQTGLLR
jgi:hypothetical protein